MSRSNRLQGLPPKIGERLTAPDASHFLMRFSPPQKREKRDASHLPGAITLPKGATERTQLQVLLQRHLLNPSTCLLTTHFIPHVLAATPPRLARLARRSARTCHFGPVYKDAFGTQLVLGLRPCHRSFTLYTQPHLRNPHNYRDAHEQVPIAHPNNERTSP